MVGWCGVCFVFLDDVGWLRTTLLRVVDFDVVLFSRGADCGCMFYRVYWLAALLLLIVLF